MQHMNSFLCMSVNYTVCCVDSLELHVFLFLKGWLVLAWWNIGIDTYMTIFEKPCDGTV